MISPDVQRYKGSKGEHIKKQYGNTPERINKRACRCAYQIAEGHTAGAVKGK
jgi:hypothetical protein